jgi:hypothetical protein
VEAQEKEIDTKFTGAVTKEINRILYKAVEL